MTGFLKLMFAILFGLGFILLIFISFFVKEEELVENNIFDIKDTNLGIRDLSYSGTSLFFSNLDYIDSIYFSQKNSYNLSLQKDSIDIKLGTGTFIISLNDILKDYKIHSDAFDLEFLGIGDVYIDITEDKITIFSVSASIKLNFINLITKEILSSTYIYPHNYISFNPKKTYSFKGVDLFSINTRTNNGYIDIPLSDTFRDVQNKALSMEQQLGVARFKRLIGNDNLYLFKKYLGDLKNTFEESKKLLNVRKKYNSFNQIHSYYMEKFSFLFINDTKKSIYYRNIIISLATEILNINKYDRDKVLEMKIYLEKLKAVNTGDYNSMLEVLKNDYKILIYNKFYTNNDILNNYLSIFNKKNDNLFFLSLGNTYFIYDLGESVSLNTYFFKFLTEYREYLNLHSTNNKYLIESFVYYLGKYIDNHLFKLDSLDISADIDILKNYVELSEYTYFKDMNNTDYIKTGLYTNSNLLEVILKFFKEVIFEADRADLGYLVKKLNITVKTGQSQSLKNSIDNIIKQYNKNKDLLLSGKDESLASGYNQNSFKFDEYFSALLDYEKYKNNYEVIMPESEKDDNAIDFEAIKLYLEQFNGLNKYKLSYTIKDDYKFVVDIFIIDNHILSFDLYPTLANKIENIVIDGQEKKMTYILDDIEDLWLEICKGAQNEEKEKCDFRNFFRNVFFTEREDVVVLTEPTLTPVVTDSESVRVIKRDVLLGREFKALKGFLGIGYDNIKLNSINNGYDITIANSTLSTSTMINEESVYYKSDFFSDYMLSDKDKLHYFSNIKLKVQLGTSGDNPVYLFNGNFFNIVGKIDKNSLGEKLNEITVNFAKFNNIYHTLGENNIRLDYYIDEQKLYYEFTKNGKTIEISLVGDNIVSILSDGKELINSNMDINSLKDFLNTNI